MTIEMDVDPEKKTIVMCKAGIRSAKVCQMLLSLGKDVHMRGRTNDTVDR